MTQRSARAARGAPRSAPPSESVKTVVAVRVIPRARNTELAGTRDGAILVRVAAPPVEGAANDALLDFLAGRLHLPRRNVRIVSGESSRTKRIEITGIDAPEAARRLHAIDVARRL